ncbi:nucleotidyl transferase AbiEii/AbiGii toxin family protein [Aquimarina sediminis]|uniref:nucleotidyl transferase AbiEii/AbiGii toxin family protein n=1 Tax=Aquimarina sediminis TaxID=2070536 RepID=UPI000CA04672|nr:nucleotidyl transferase AbiEii/AbiGii toxin family protein [Aquimarina sediminis]
MKDIALQLQNIAKESMYSYSELVELYAMEGLIRRVARSEYKDLFVLRGGMMSRFWYSPGKWMPQDVDFMVDVPVDPIEMESRWQDILQDNLIHDGVSFDPATLRSEIIWIDAKDPGLRLFVSTVLEEVNISFLLQIDISYSDPTIPAASFQEYPSIIPNQSIYCKMVYRETSAGWKFYGLFERKQDKWRPKDLFGLYWLIKNYDLDLSQVMNSFKETSFERGTPLEIAARFFEGKFGQGKNSRSIWRAFCKTHPSFKITEDLQEVLTVVRTTLQPLYMDMIANYSYISKIGNTGFPIIEHIDQVLPAIKDRDEFQVFKKEGYQIIDYTIPLKYSFIPITQAIHSSVANIYALRRECRGLIFDSEGTLVARKFHKFFRIGEREESQIENIDWSSSCRVTEKLDGSLVSPVLWNGILRWTTRKGPSAIADQAATFADNTTRAIQKETSDIGYLPLIKELLEGNWTPTFEWCSRQHPIVLDHPKDRLVLTTIRNNLTGGYLNYDTMVTMAKYHKIEYVKQVRWIHSIEEAKDFIQKISSEKQGEGYVLRFDDDRFYKVKNNQYIKLHDLVAHPHKEIYIWQATLELKIDTMLDLVAPGLRPQIKNFSIGLSQAIHRQSIWLQSYIESAKNTIDKKTKDNQLADKMFAVEYASTLDLIRKKICFIAWHKLRMNTGSMDYEQIIRAFLIPRCKTRRSLSKMRSLIDVTFVDKGFPDTGGY